MKNEKKNWAIPRSVAIRGAWLCGGSMLALFLVIITDPRLMQLSNLRNTYVTMLIAAIFGLALFIGNWVNSTQQGVIYGHKKLLNLRSAAYPTYHFYGGTPKQYEEFFSPEIGADEQVALVAWRHRNGNIYAVERPGRHGHVTTMLAELDMAGQENMLDDGFVTNHGRWVNRKEALIIASAQGQMIRNTGPVNELFSEDLWYTPKESRSAAYDLRQLGVAEKRQLILSTLPSLAYLHDEKIQITKEELEELGEIKKSVGVIAQEVRSVVPDAVVDAALDCLKKTDEVEPIPETGILTVSQGIRLYNAAMHDFFNELDAEIAITKRFIPKELLKMREHRNSLIPLVESDRWDLDLVLDDMKALAAASRTLRNAKMYRLTEHADDIQLYRSSEIRRAAEIVAGRLPQADGEWILKGAERLIGMACEHGVVLTIELQPRDPAHPSMGQYYMVPEVRECYASYQARLQAEREQKEQYHVQRL